METTIHEGEEYYKVLPGYSFVTFDMVAEPSVHNSYMSLIDSPRKDSSFQVAESKDRLITNFRSREKEIIAELRNQLFNLR